MERSAIKAPVVVGSRVGTVSHNFNTQDPLSWRRACQHVQQANHCVSGMVRECCDPTVIAPPGRIRRWFEGQCLSTSRVSTPGPHTLSLSLSLSRVPLSSRVRATGADLGDQHLLFQVHTQHHINARVLLQLLLWYTHLRAAPLSTPASQRNTARRNPAVATAQAARGWTRLH